MRMNPALIMYLMMMASCATQQQTSTSTPSGSYSEDLSTWRPAFEIPPDSALTPTQDDGKEKPYVEPRYTVNKELDTVLDSINRINLTRKYVDGFTIQLYTGLNREEALNTKKKLCIELPELESEVTYAQPNFKVKSGRYFTRMEAQKDFIAIKKVFGNAIIIPDRIKILE
jgi:hypothetical protein